jgi:hypothetical protein
VNNPGGAKSGEVSLKLGLLVVVPRTSNTPRDAGGSSDFVPFVSTPSLLFIGSESGAEFASISY